MKKAIHSDRLFITSDFPQALWYSVCGIGLQVTARQITAVHRNTVVCIASNCYHNCTSIQSYLKTGDTDVSHLPFLSTAQPQ
jgi:hypothetical protein